MLTLRNDALSVTIDASSGALVAIENKHRGLQLLDSDIAARLPAWRLQNAPGTPESDWWTPASLSAAFGYEQSPGRLDLSWRCAEDITVRAVVELPPGDRPVTFSVAVSNVGSTEIGLVEYPVVHGIGDLGTASTKRLLHPYATGFVVEEPLETFEPGRGVWPAPYPEGFSGCPLQVMAYYADDVGGFSFTADDATGWAKWIDARRSPEGDCLTVRFLHGAADVRPGNGVDPPYTVSVTALREGTWYEAADGYREWARAQPFCERGPLHERADRARWLLEDVGFSVFGVTTRHDRAAWLRFFHEIADVPVFHVTGPDWQAGNHDYRGHANGGRDQVHPAAILPSYGDTLRSQGDRFAPFTFATLFSDMSSDEAAEARSAHQVIPGRDTPGSDTLSRDEYQFKFLCPVPGLLERTARYRDTAAVGDYGASAVYWDIGPNNVLMSCLSDDHGHGRGAGADLTGAFRRVMGSVRDACSSTAGEHVPLGCEMVNEAFVPEMDFYQARAEGSPNSRFEGHPFWHWTRAGRCEKVPLFTYVYHEYGPVRLDGWAQLAAEQGDLFFWVAARVFAWGGLFELNYEFTSLDSVDGQVQDMAEHYASRVEPRSNPVREESVAFVREIALARVGFANKYVAYGEMQRPLPLSVPDVDLSWFHYDSPTEAEEYGASGVHTVPSVVHAAWRYRRDSCGFLFVNLLTEPQDITVTIEPSRYGLDADNLRLREVTLDGAVDGGVVHGETLCAVTLPSRRVVLLELVGSPDDALE